MLSKHVLRLVEELEIYRDVRMNPNTKQETLLRVLSDSRIKEVVVPVSFRVARDRLKNLDVEQNTLDRLSFSIPERLVADPDLLAFQVTFMKWDYMPGRSQFCFFLPSS